MSDLLITGFIGMNNLQDKRRLKGPVVSRDRSAYPAECRKIVNFDITDTLDALFRPGRALALACTPHSLWATKDESQAYYVDGSFKRLFAGSPYYTAVSLRSLSAPSLPLSYAEINYLIACSNGVDLFLVENGVASDFVFSSENFKERVMAGHILAAFNRRLYVALANALYHTDADNIERLDERDDPFVFGSMISMVLPMENGMYVSADKTYWLAGRGPDEFIPRMAYEGRAVEGTGLVIDGALLAEKDFPIQDGTACIFTAEDGICVGNDQGQVFNLTSDTLGFTAQSRGAALIRKQGDFNQYISWV